MTMHTPRLMQRMPRPFSEADALAALATSIARPSGRARIETFEQHGKRIMYDHPENIDIPGFGSMDNRHL